MSGRTDFCIALAGAEVRLSQAVLNGTSRFVVQENTRGAHVGNGASTPCSLAQAFSAGQDPGGPTWMAITVV